MKITNKVTIKATMKGEDHNISKMLLREMIMLIQDKQIHTEVVVGHENNISSSNNPDETLWAEE
jgi:hypothetical protein